MSHIGWIFFFCITLTLSIHNKQQFNDSEKEGPKTGREFEEKFLFYTRLGEGKEGKQSKQTLQEIITRASVKGFVRLRVLFVPSLICVSTQ